MIFIRLRFTSAVCVCFSLCSDLFICVCPCVQCAGSDLRAALWDKRTNPWPLRLSGTSGIKSVILQMPPSLRLYKVRNALGWLHTEYHIMCWCIVYIFMKMFTTKLRIRVIPFYLNEHLFLNPVTTTTMLPFSHTFSSFESESRVESLSLETCWSAITLFWLILCWLRGFV